MYTHSENSIHLGLTVQNFVNLVPRSREASILIPLNYVKFYLFILANAKNFMCLASVVKKFEFWWTHFRRKPPFWYPKLWSNLFFLYLLSSNTSCFQLKRLKTLNFGRPRLGGLPISKPPFFVRFSLFLISTHSQNSVHSPLTV